MPVPQRPERFAFTLPADTPQALADFFTALETSINVALYNLGEGPRILPALSEIPGFKIMLNWDGVAQAFDAYRSRTQADDTQAIFMNAIDRELRPLLSWMDTFGDELSTGIRELAAEMQNALNTRPGWVDRVKTSRTSLHELILFLGQEYVTPMNQMYRNGMQQFDGTAARVMVLADALSGLPRHRGEQAARDQAERRDLVSQYMEGGVMTGSQEDFARRSVAEQRTVLWGEKRGNPAVRNELSTMIEAGVRPPWLGLELPNSTQSALDEYRKSEGTPVDQMVLDIALTKVGIIDHGPDQRSSLVRLLDTARKHSIPVYALNTGFESRDSLNTFLARNAAIAGELGRRPDGGWVLVGNDQTGSKHGIEAYLPENKRGTTVFSQDDWDRDAYRGLPKVGQTILDVERIDRGIPQPLPQGFDQEPWQRRMMTRRLCVDVSDCRWQSARGRLCPTKVDRQSRILLRATAI